MYGAVLSSLNSTETPLGSSTLWEGVFEEALHFAAITTTIKSDVASLSDGVQFVWSPDKVSSYVTFPVYTYRLLDDYGNPLGGQVFVSEIYGRYFQVAFNKDISVQSQFSVQTILHYAPIQLPLAKLTARYDREAVGVNVRPVPMTVFPINRSGTIATGGVAQTVMAANPKRKWARFQNVSDTDMWLNDRGAAAVANQPSLQIYPGGYWETDPGCSGEAVSVFCATTGKAYTADEV